MRKQFDFWSIVVIVLTLLLFIVALFQKGLTHDLLLEAGVFLVSVKLIMMSHKSRTMAGEIEDRLEEIKSMLRKMQERKPA
jgi:protein-S-isoprenylcysteine O-methyltransferase Ste14